MGSGVSSLPAEVADQFTKLSPDHQTVAQAKFEELLAQGKTPEEAISFLADLAHHIIATRICHYDTSYDEWKADYDSYASDRATYCNESRTMFGQIDTQTACIVYFELDIPKMLANLEQFKVEHADNHTKWKQHSHQDLYINAPIDASNNTKTGVLISRIAHLEADGLSYDQWRDVFLTQADNRALYCDDTKTLYGKVNDTTAFILEQDVDVAKLIAATSQFVNDEVFVSTPVAELA